MVPAQQQESVRALANGYGFFICQVMLCIALDYRVSETLCTLADLELALDQ